MNVGPLLRLLLAQGQGPSPARAAPRAQPAVPQPREASQEGVQVPGSTLRWRLEDGRERLGGAVRTLDPKLVPVGEPPPPPPARRTPNRRRVVALWVLAVALAALVAVGVATFLRHEAPSLSPAVTAPPAPAATVGPASPVGLGFGNPLLMDNSGGGRTQG